MKYTAILLAAAFLFILSPGPGFTEEDKMVTRDQFIQILRSTGTTDDSPDKKRVTISGKKRTSISVTVHILFKKGTTELADDFSIRQLKEAGEALSSDALRGLHLEIAGHTDNMGSEIDNIKLSLERAKAVKRFLVQFYGISEDLLISTGYGESEPITDNSMEEGRAHNRRVVFIRLE